MNLNFIMVVFKNGWSIFFIFFFVDKSFYEVSFFNVGVVNY